MEYIEKDCTITHQGKSFTSGGAVITPDIVIGYVGDKVDGKNYRILTDWHGNAIGRCRITSTWENRNSWQSSTMHQIVAIVDGIAYTGRGMGLGMIYKGKKCRTANSARIARQLCGI